MLPRAGLVLLLVLASPAAARAQDVAPPSAYVPVTTRVLLQDAGAYVTSPLHWTRAQAWRAAAVAGAIGLVLVVDEDVQRWVQERRTATRDDVAQFFTTVGIALPLAAGGTAWAAGAARGDPRLRATGRDALEAAAFAGALGELVLKPAFGRQRPRNTGGESVWEPFSWGENSFPSGHASVSFAVATAFAAHAEGRLVPVAAYGFATLVSLSRVEQDAHFLGDVVAGAALGIVTGEFVARRHGASGPEPPRTAAVWRLVPAGRGLVLQVVW